VFDNEPLSAVAARVGRYAPHPVIAEGRAAEMRLSGVFDAGDLRTFTEAVQRVLPVTVETTADGVIHLRASAS
jgi:transmembrane sensor